jgi:hypothetical protein
MDLLRLKSEPPVVNDIALGANVTRTTIVVDSRRRIQTNTRMTESIELLPPSPLQVTKGSNRVGVTSSLLVNIGDLVAIDRITPASATVNVTASSDGSMITMRGNFMGLFGEASRSLVSISGGPTFGLPGFVMEQPQLVYYERGTLTIDVSPIKTRRTSPFSLPLQFKVYNIGGIPIDALTGTFEVVGLSSTGFYYTIPTPTSTVTSWSGSAQVATAGSFDANGGGTAVTASLLYRIVPGFQTPSSYEFQLDTIFSNVLAFRLSSSEFPYTMRVMDSTSNSIGWQNALGSFSASVPVASYTRSSLLEAIVKALNDVDPNQVFYLKDNGVEWTISCFYSMQTTSTIRDGAELVLPNHSLKPNGFVRINGTPFLVVSVLDPSKVTIRLPVGAGLDPPVRIEYPMLVSTIPSGLWSILGLPTARSLTSEIKNTAAVRAAPAYLSIRLQQVGGAYTGDVTLGRIRTYGQPGDTMIDTFVSNGVDFDHPVESLNSLRVTIVDENDEEADLGMGDHSFTLVVYHRDRGPIGSNVKK